MFLVLISFLFSFIVILALAAKFLKDEEDSHLPPLHVNMPEWWYSQE